MTAETYSPPLRAVYTPTDAADAADVLARQKSRWGMFLIARDAVLDAAHGIWSRSAQLVEKLGLTSVVQMARRGLSWFLKGLERTSEYLRAPGVRPGLLWALTTSCGQKVAGEVASNVGKAVGTAVRWTYRTLIGGLRRLGKLGQAAANRVEDLATKAKRSVLRLRPVGEAVQLILSPKGLASHLVSAWTRFKILTLLVVRRLPRPWNLLGWLVAVGLSLPSKVRKQAYGVVRDMSTSKTVGTDDDPTPPPAHVRLVPPPAFSESDSTAAVVVEPVAVNEVPAHEEAIAESLAASMQRHPATKRSPNARKRR